MTQRSSSVPESLPENPGPVTPPGENPIKHGNEQPERKVPFQRFQEVNREAREARALQGKLGLSDEEWSDFLANPQAFMGQGGDFSYHEIDKRLKSIEHSVGTITAHSQKQAEENEWNRAVSERPEIAPYKNVIVELGRTARFANQSYLAIFDSEIAPAHERTSAQTEDERNARQQGAHVQKPSSRTIPPAGGEEEMTPQKFDKLTLEQKRKWLQDNNVTVETASAVDGE